MQGEYYFMLRRNTAIGEKHSKPVGLLGSIDYVKVVMVTLLFLVIFRDTSRTLPCFDEVSIYRR
jgi:hypothetical protein